MLQDLLNLVKEHATESVVNNPAIPNSQNNAVISDATHSIADGLQKELSGGGLQNILSMFGGGGNSNSLMSNPIVGSIISNFTNKLTGNYGVQSSQASGIAASLIPGVISSLISKTQDPNNSNFTMDGLLHSLTGGASTQTAQQQGGGFSFQNLIGQIAGGNGGGLQNIISSVTGGAQQQQGGGGLMNVISGLFH